MSFLILVIIIAGLVVISDMGVNVTPLLAGASAVSFGSQALVRDIISGIFYLADDAFRVGEYIDCGKAKGTVEGFTLRSIRLHSLSCLTDIGRFAAPPTRNRTPRPERCPEPDRLANWAGSNACLRLIG
jgi:small-conductance mechanosensitive channel